MSIESIISEIRVLLKKAEKPLFFFDDDVDGLSSYLLLLHFCKSGKGTIIKSTPKLSEDYKKKIDKYKPDLVIILDKPQVDSSFFTVSTPVIWIDHHQPQEHPDSWTYLNPRVFDDLDNRCTSYWCYQITQQNEWIGACGCIADWQIPDFIPEVVKKYPQLVDPKQTYTSAPDYLYNSPLGTLIQMLTFSLKGKKSDTSASIKSATKIKNPVELLEHTTAEAQLLQKRFEFMSQEYHTIITQMKEQCNETDSICALTYTTNFASITTELGNELHYLFPNQIIVIGRLHNEHYKCSLRSPHTVDLPKILTTIFTNMDGYGGGHTHACGACVHENDWDDFIQQIEDLS